MIVELRSEGAEVVQADDLGRLHVSTDLPASAVQEALHVSGLGTLFDGERVVLLIAELRRRAAEASTARDWDRRWAAMIDFARAHAWTTDDGAGLLAHVEFHRGTPHD